MEKSVEELQKQRSILVDALKDEYSPKNNFYIGLGLALTIAFGALAFIQTGIFLVGVIFSCFIWMPKIFKRRGIKKSIKSFDQYFKKVEAEKAKDEQKKKEGENQQEKQEKKEGEKQGEKQEKQNVKPGKTVPSTTSVKTSILSNVTKKDLESIDQVVVGQEFDK